MYHMVAYESNVLQLLQCVCINQYNAVYTDAAPTALTQERSNRIVDCTQ
jgi:hypothetical protein